MAASSSKRSGLAIGAVILLYGFLFLINTLYPFSKLGLGWILKVDNLILYAAILFLFLKKDKTDGAILALIWILVNFQFVIELLGSMSGYVIPGLFVIVGLFLVVRALR